MPKWTLAAFGAALILVGSLLAFMIQTSGGAVAVHDVRYPAKDGAVLSGLLYVPKGATAQSPAPAILVSHGLINTREMQSPFAIEMSRRGYVVLAMDMSGHGYSGGVLGQNAAGGPDAFAYLQSLAFVDKANLGLEGHSLGGAPTIAAARANPDGYKAIVLEGSSPSLAGGRRPATAAPVAAPSPLRNLLVVYGQYDEFAQTMWGVPKGSLLPTSKRLISLFGANGDVVPGQVYGSIADGTARMLILPAIDHPQEHFTKAGVGAAIDWFEKIMPSAKPLASSDQTWLWKEIGTLIGFTGCVFLILGVFHWLVLTKTFASLLNVGAAAAERRDVRWWTGFVLSAAVPALLYFPTMENGQKIFMAPFGWVGATAWAGKTFAEQVNNQLVVWALASGLVSLLLSLILQRGKTAFSHRWGLAAAAAVISVAAGYLALVLVDLVFKVDFRFWVLGLKPFDLRHFGFFLLYLPFFVVFFLLAMRGFAGAIPVRGEGKTAAVVWGGLAMSLGFMVLLLMQYGVMRQTGLLMHGNALLTIVAFQFVPLLFVIGLIGAFTWRLTNSYEAGAFICALFITWYVTTGTAIYPVRPPTPAPTAPLAATPAPPPAPN
jgi:pimeloyl-ACP methyl ester carboxylesterase